MSMPTAVPIDASAIALPLRRRSRLSLPAALLLLLWLSLFIGMRNLTLPDEGRYVGVAWEMLRSGNWLLPTQDGLPFFHKPPLFYWITAASMQWFGVNAAAARAAPLIGALVGAQAIAWFLGRRVDAGLARWTLAVLATLPFFFGGAQFANLDMLVAGFIALTIVLAADAALRAQAGEPHGCVLAGAWAAAGLGVLAKGLIGVVLPGLVLVPWLLLTGRPGMVWRLVSPLGVAVFLFVAAPWFIAVQMRYPGFAHYFFVYQHFERFAATGFNNVQPWWFFLGVVPGLALPWSMWLARSAARRRASAAAALDPVRLLMWVWLCAILAFFSIPKSKPVGYAMPVLFPLAALAADGALAAWRSGRRAQRRVVQASFALGLLLCLGGLAGMTWKDHRNNTSLGRTLLLERGTDDPVVFIGEYFFDIPLHAQLRGPVPVSGDWQDPAIAAQDNWRRELAEAAAFEPTLAATLLVDAPHALALRCGLHPLWVVVKADAEATVAAVPGARRIAESNGAALWRLKPQACAPLAAPP